MILILTMIAAAAINPVLEELSWGIAQSRTPKVRTMRQYTEDELIIPEGPHKDERWRLYRQPFVGLLLDAIDSGNWTRFAIAGCVQGGKSLFGFVNPTGYHLFECKDNVILGVPNTNVIGRDKWNNEIKPTIEASRYAGLMPTRGVGSQGGWGNEVAFDHGAKLKFMTGTGGDENRSSYTARVVVCTEIDKMDRAGEISREADPITQLAARSNAWDRPDRRLYMECTVSHTEGRIWQEYTKGTASRIACPCPYCRGYVTPERDSIQGWEDAANEFEAEENACFVCPACEHKLTEDDRREMNRAAVLLHRGQEIDNKGTITGPLPPTRTLGFRWNAFNNMFWSPAAIGVAEWLGVRARDKESAERELSQFYWTTPWDPPNIKLAPLDAETVAKRTAGYKKGIVPAECVGISVGVDTHKRHLDWTAMAWLAGNNGFVIDYGEQTVLADKLGLVQGFRQAFGELRTYLESGWHSVDGKIIRPSQVWIDSGYHEHKKPVYSFCLLANKGCEPGAERYRPTKGTSAGKAEVGSHKFGPLEIGLAYSPRDGLRGAGRDRAVRGSRCFRP
ncbi:MAG: terminase gpA endonuclease subunit, partial [Planctomycetota bacterium]